MSRKTIGKRNTTVGNYSIREARASVHDTESAVWRVYFKQAVEHLSEHPTRPDAIAAVKRYIEGDARRTRAVAVALTCR